MADILKKEDARKRKTRKSLQSALIALLERRSFKKITVNDICEEALISRATFYLHFQDKFALIDDWFSRMAQSTKSEEALRSLLDTLVFGKSRLMKNLFDSLDFELLSILHEFLSSVLDRAIKNQRGRTAVDQAFLMHFAVGGFMHFLIRQIGQNERILDKSETRLHIDRLIDYLKLY